MVNILFIKFKMIKELNSSGLETLEREVNEILNESDKATATLIKQFFDIKELVSRHKNAEMLSIFSILAEWVDKDDHLECQQ